MKSAKSQTPAISASEKALQKEQAEMLRLQRETIVREQEFQQMLTPLLLEESGIKPVYDESGALTGYEKASDPNQALREQIEGKFLERSMAALEGDLPVDPALMRDLDKYVQETENQIRKQFGDLTSTPAQEAMQRANESVMLAKDSARRGDLTLAEQLGMGRLSSNEGLIDSTINRGATIAGMGRDFASLYGSAVSGYSSAMQPYQFNRQMQFNVDQVNASRSSPLGSIIGGIAGAGIGAMTGGVGAAAGAKLGESLFGA